MNKFNKILLAVIVILLIGVGYLVFVLKDKIWPEKNYYAVYLASGDIYFGRLHFFPYFRLTEARYLTRGADSQNFAGPSFNLVKFSDSLWGPEEELKLNPKNVLWISKLRDDSQVVKLYGGE